MLMNIINILEMKLYHIWWPLLTSEVKLVGFTLNTGKCEALLPLALEGDHSEELQRIGLPQTFGYINALGSVAEGAFETQLSLVGLAHEPKATLKREIAAVKLARQLQQMVTLPMRRPARAVAWMILSKVLAVALDYDARVSRSWAFGQIAERHDRVVSATAACILAEDTLDQQTEVRLRLHVRHGGASIPATRDKAAFGPLGQVALCLASVQSNVRQVIRGC